VTGIDWAGRIGRHITAEGSVVVPPRIAEWIESQIGLVSERRIKMADADPLAYAVLSALRLVALQQRDEGVRGRGHPWWTANGTKVAVIQQHRQELDVWLTAVEAAAAMGVTDSAIRKWIRTGRLPAIKRGGRWLINRSHLNIRALTA